MMAKNPAQTTTAHDVEEIPPAMDYEAHNATYNGFIQMVKWAIIATLIGVVALYFFIIGNQPVVGTVLLLLIPAGAVAAMVMGSRRT
jgi:hypothetical protein